MNMPTPARPLRCAAVSLMLVLAGCGVLPKKQDITIYTALAHAEPDPSWPTTQAKLSIARPSSNALLDTARMVVRPKPGELQVYAGAVWSDPVPEMVQNAVLRVLQDSGRIRNVDKRGTGVSGDYLLLMDVRRFDSDYGDSATPTAVVEIAAQLVSTKRDQVLAYRLFSQRIPTTTTAVPKVAEAMQQATTQVSRDIAGWTLQEMANR